MLHKFPWKSFLIDGLVNNLTGLNINENEIIIVKNWNYIVKAVDLFYDYSTNKNRQLINNLFSLNKKKQNGFNLNFLYILEYSRII